METTTLFFIIAGAIALGSIVIILKLKTMDNYKITREIDSDGNEKVYAKIRRGFSYHYIKLVDDFPGFENDVFEISKEQTFGQESLKLAETIVYNHKMTKITGKA